MKSENSLLSMLEKNCIKPADKAFELKGKLDLFSERLIIAKTTNCRTLAYYPDIFSDIPHFGQ